MYLIACLQGEIRGLSLVEKDQNMSLQKGEQNQILRLDLPKSLQSAQARISPIYLLMIVLTTKKQLYFGAFGEDLSEKPEGSKHV